MKTLLCSATTLLCSIVCAQKIIVVDIDYVLECHPNTPGDRETISLTVEEYAKERDELLSNLKGIENELETITKQAQNPMLAQSKKEELLKKGESLYMQMAQARQAAEAQIAQRRKDLQELDARLVRRSTKDVLEKVNAYAKAEEVDIILDKRNVPFCADKYDATKDIIRLCGGKIPAEAPQAEAPAKPAAVEKPLEAPAKL